MKFENCCATVMHNLVAICCNNEEIIATAMLQARSADQHLDATQSVCLQLDISHTHACTHAV